MAPDKLVLMGWGMDNTQNSLAYDNIMVVA